MQRITAIILGALVGIAVSVICGLVYLGVLHEPGPAFYPFAALVFLGGPILGGTVAALKSEHKFKAFAASSGISFGVVFVLFFVTYAAVPQLSRESVQLPEACDGFDGNLNPPSALSSSIIVTNIPTATKTFPPNLFRYANTNNLHTLSSQHLSP